MPTSRRGLTLTLTHTLTLTLTLTLNLALTLTPALTLALTLARWAKESRAQSSGEYAAVGQQEGAELRGGVVVGGDGDTFDSGGVGHAAELQAAP